MTLPLERNLRGRFLHYDLGREVYGVKCCANPEGFGLPLGSIEARFLHYDLGREVYGAVCCMREDGRVYGRYLHYDLGREVYGFSQPCCPTDDGGSGSGSGSGADQPPPSCRLACWNNTAGPFFVLDSPGTTGTSIRINDPTGLPSPPFYMAWLSGGLYEIVTVTAVTPDPMTPPEADLTVQRGCNQLGECTGTGQNIGPATQLTWEQDPPDTLLATASIFCDPALEDIPVTLTRYDLTCGERSAAGDFDNSPQCGWGGTFSDSGGNLWTVCLYSLHQGQGSYPIGSLSWDIILNCNGTPYAANVVSGEMTLMDNDCVPLDIEITYFGAEAPCDCLFRGLTVVE